LVATCAQCSALPCENIPLIGDSCSVFLLHPTKGMVSCSLTAASSLASILTPVSHPLHDNYNSAVRLFGHTIVNSIHEEYLETLSLKPNQSARVRRRRWHFATTSREDGRAAPALTLRWRRSIYQCGDGVKRMVATHERARWIV
jgi:hypothetical protein